MKISIKGTKSELVLDSFKCTAPSSQTLEEELKVAVSEEDELD